MSEIGKAAPQHWTVEENRTYKRKDVLSGIVLRYHPTPVPKVKEDGSQTVSLSFPVLALTDWVSDPQKSAEEIAASLNDAEALTAERDALKAENAKLHAEREAVWYWIRHPDWADEFSQSDLLKWLDKRPSHLTRPLREETAEREKTARAAIKW